MKTQAHTRIRKALHDLLGALDDYHDARFYDEEEDVERTCKALDKAVAKARKALEAA
jgi:hypothetical protein